jgi:hypothetical protein
MAKPLNSQLAGITEIDLDGTGSVNFNSAGLVNAGDGYFSSLFINNQDAATKSWVSQQLLTVQTPGSTNFVHENLQITTIGQTEFELSYNPVDGYNTTVIMFLNQLKVDLIDYNVNGTTLTYTGEALDVSDNIEVYYPVIKTTVPVFRNISSCISENDFDLWKVVGLTEIDSSEIDGYTSLEVILFTSDGISDGYARLFNSTTQEQIGNILNTTNDVPTLLSENINLTSGSNLYELQIRFEQDGTGEFVYCGMGRIKVDSTIVQDINILPILSGISTTDRDVWREVGIIEINPSEYKYNTSTFEVLLSSTDGYISDDLLVAEVRLYNVTEQTAISSVLTTESNSAQLLQEEVTLSAGSNLYSVQFRLSENSEVDFATCSMARIKLE